jgi:hypothetical protein
VTTRSRDDKSSRFFAIDELLAVITGLAICNTYHDDETLAEIPIRALLDPENDRTFRIMYDWVNNLRFHSHSPHSLIFTFELIANENNPSDDPDISHSTRKGPSNGAFCISRQRTGKLRCHEDIKLTSNNGPTRGRGHKKCHRGTLGHTPSEDTPSQRKYPPARPTRTRSNMSSPPQKKKRCPMASVKDVAQYIVEKKKRLTTV